MKIRSLILYSITIATLILIHSPISANPSQGWTLEEIQERREAIENQRFLDRFDELLLEQGLRRSDFSGNPEVQQNINNAYIALGRSRCRTLSESPSFATSVALDIWEIARGDEDLLRSIALLDAAVDVFCPNGAENWEQARAMLFENAL